MPPDSPTAVLPSNDARPNSGLREGDISHADVNTAIRGAAKTIIFGQQNRLRNGILMGDEKLPRFHAGHELVRFFYQGMNKLPEYLLDALLDSEISITLVTGPAATASDARAAEKARAAGGDLLVFDHFRQHQSFHIGYTRRTIYIPEGILREAVYKGWDSWAIAEAVIREACPLLDYRLLLNFILRSQQRLRSHFTIGSQTVIKNAFLRMNKHLVVSENEENEESEFEAFLRYYGQKFFKFDRNILDQDSYELADSIFDEPQEREWSNQKVNQISTTYDFPDFFDLDRDIVHPAAHRAAETVGQSTEPETVDDIIHDMADAARFRHLRQTRTNALIDQLLAKGGPGIQAFADAAGNERATGDLTICANHHDNYDTVIVFKEKLQALSNTGPEGIPREHLQRLSELSTKKNRSQNSGAPRSIHGTPRQAAERTPQVLQTNGQSSSRLGKFYESRRSGHAGRKRRSSQGRRDALTVHAEPPDEGRRGSRAATDAERLEKTRATRRLPRHHHRPDRRIDGRRQLLPRREYP